MIAFIIAGLCGFVLVMAVMSVVKEIKREERFRRLSNKRYKKKGY